MEESEQNENDTMESMEEEKEKDNETLPLVIETTTEASTRLECVLPNANEELQPMNCDIVTTGSNIQESLKHSDDTYSSDDDHESNLIIDSSVIVQEMECDNEAFNSDPIVKDFKSDSKVEEKPSFLQEELNDNEEDVKMEEDVSKTDDSTEQLQEELRNDSTSQSSSINEDNQTQLEDLFLAKRELLLEVNKISEEEDEVEEGELEEGELEDENEEGKEGTNDNGKEQKESNEEKIVIIKNKGKKKKSKEDSKRKRDDENTKRKKRKHAQYSSEEEAEGARKKDAPRDKGSDFDLLLKHQQMYLLGGPTPEPPFQPEMENFETLLSQQQQKVAEDADSVAESVTSDEWEDKPASIRRRLKRRRNSRSPSRKNEAICMFYLQGSCRRANDCPYSHEISPTRKMELCKFYMMDCCAKKEKCLYMHKDFPCKYYHFGFKCKDGELCRFSHNPLQEITKNILLKHIELAPKDILGDFPRVSKHSAKTVLCVTEAKRNSEPIPSENLEAVEDYEGKGFRYLDRALKSWRKSKNKEKGGGSDKEKSGNSPDKDNKPETDKNEVTEKEVDKKETKEKEKEKIDIKKEDKSETKVKSRDKEGRTRSSKKSRSRDKVEEDHRSDRGERSGAPRDSERRHRDRDKGRDRDRHRSGGGSRTSSRWDPTPSSSSEGKSRHDLQHHSLERNYEERNNSGDSFKTSNKRWPQSDDEDSKSSGDRRHRSFSPGRKMVDEKAFYETEKSNFDDEKNSFGNEEPQFGDEESRRYEEEKPRRRDEDTKNIMDHANLANIDFSILKNVLNSVQSNTNHGHPQEEETPASNWEKRDPSYSKPMNYIDDLKDVFYDPPTEPTPPTDIKDFSRNLSSFIQNARDSSKTSNSVGSSSFRSQGPKESLLGPPPTGRRPQPNTWEDIPLHQHSLNHLADAPPLRRTLSSSSSHPYDKNTIGLSASDNMHPYRGLTKPDDSNEFLNAKFKPEIPKVETNTQPITTASNLPSRRVSEDSDDKSNATSIYQFGPQESTEDEDEEENPDGLPFKVPIHSSAKEIEASLASRPHFYYQLLIVTVPKPNFLRRKFNKDDPKTSEDPRIQKMFQNASSAESKSSIERSPPSESRNQRNNVNRDPRSLAEPRVDPRIARTTDPRSDPRAANGLRLDPRAVSDLRMDPRAANDLRMDPRSACDPRMDPRAVNDLRIDPRSVNEHRMDPRSANDLRMDPRASSDHRFDSRASSFDPRSSSDLRYDARSSSDMRFDTRASNDSHPDSRGTSSRVDPRSNDSRMMQQIDHRNLNRMHSREAMLLDSDHRSNTSNFDNEMMEGPQFPYMSGPLMPQGIDPRGRPGLLGPGPNRLGMGLQSDPNFSIGVGPYHPRDGLIGSNYPQGWSSGGSRPQFNDPRRNGLDLGS